MENAVDALKMAAAILIFMVALATSFSLFGTAKQTADSIILTADKQSYLEAAELDNGVLYTSSSSIKGDITETDITKEYISGVTKNGDRVVKIDDVISTIYRYSKEKYGVTIVKSDRTVLARFDSNTEHIMSQYNSIAGGFGDYINKLEKNTENEYAKPIFDDLNELYKLTPRGYGAPWYGNEEQIQKRINHDLKGTTYEYNGQKYDGKGLLSILESAGKIIEVTNEIDNSVYLKEDIDGDGIDDNTNLLQQYEMATIEIVYIVY